MKTKMKQNITKNQTKIIIATIWIVLSILVWSLIPASRKGPMGFGPPASMTIFKASDGSFSILSPANWVAFNLPQGYHGDKEIVASIAVSGREFAIINIAHKLFPDGKVNDVVDWGQSRAARSIDYVPTPLIPLSDSELTGFVQDYKWLHSSYDKILMHCQDVYVLANNDGYALSFCSKEEDWTSLKDIYIEMQQSFSIRGEK